MRRPINIVRGSEVQTLNFYCQKVKGERKEYYRYEVVDPLRMLRILQLIRKRLSSEHYNRKINNLIREIIMVGQTG